MTDEEKFQKTFDKLHASPDVLTEVLKMTAKEQVVPMKKKRFTPKAAAAIAAVVLAAGSGSAAYAMDVGGIQRIVQVWIHGDQTDAIFNVENGNYTLDYKDADGNDVSQGGGGVAYENGYNNIPHRSKNIFINPFNTNCSNTPYNARVPIITSSL